MQKLIIGLINLAVSIFLVFILVWPLCNSIRLERAVLSEKTAEIEGLKELLRETERLKEEYREISQSAEKFFQAMPAEKDIPHFLVQLEELAQGNGLLLESVSFESEEEELKQKSKIQPSAESGPKTDGLFKLLKTGIALSGSYESFKGYLTAIENSLRPISIHSIMVSADKSQAEQTANLDIFQFDLNLSVYYTVGEI